MNAMPTSRASVAKEIAGVETSPMPAATSMTPTTMPPTRCGQPHANQQRRGDHPTERVTDEQHSYDDGSNANHCREPAVLGTARERPEHIYCSVNQDEYAGDDDERHKAVGRFQQHDHADRDTQQPDDHEQPRGAMCS